MNLKNIASESTLKKAGNVLFYSLMIFFVFSTDAKAWMLKQLVSLGLFQTEIKKGPSAKDMAQHNVSFSYYDANGRVVSSADLKGKVVFVNFWATWCPPCRAEMPSLSALYNQFKDDDRYVFLFISEDEDLTKAKSYLQKEGFDIPLASRAGDVPAQIYSGTLPTTIVFNKDGQVVLKKEGIAGYNTPAFIKQLKDLL
jgi:thiol-disulfide isomerase/thioredoxin